MEKPFAILQFIYKKKGKYNINILSSNMLNLLRDTYQIEKIELEADQKDIKNTFHIKESIKVLIDKSPNSDNFIAKTENYIRIFYSKQFYFVKVSIEGRNQNNFLLSIALAVYSKHYDSLKPIFIAKKLIHNIKSSGIFQPNNAEETIEKLRGKYSLQNQTINPINRRSNSLNKNNLNFGLKEKESNKEINFNYSNLNLNNIPHLARSISTKVFGLMNLGNTCFLNSSLQIIIHSPIFIEKFLKDIYILRPQNNTLAYIFFNFIMNINSSDKNLFSPKSLISKFLEKCNMFSLGEQSDSQRFYRNFMTILEKEFGNSNSCIKETFEGKFVYTNEFNCQNKFCGNRNINTIEQSFLDIFLSVKENDLSISELIDQTYRSQSLKSSSKCNCNDNFILTRFIKICPNKYLSLNLQRGKISDRTLKNSEIKIDNIYITNNLYYEPYAMNFHTGTMDYGHYYSYVKIDDYEGNKIGKWYCFNDSHYSDVICPKSSKEVINVFYKIKNI